MLAISSTFYKWQSICKNKKKLQLGNFPVGIMNFKCSNYELVLSNET